MKTIKKFKELGIPPSSSGFEGDKIKIDRIVNRIIIINDYKIEKSKYPDRGEFCLYLQITLNDTKHIIFSSSKGLQRSIQMISQDDFPFETTIIRKDNQALEFT